ncbi:polar amino acid ABC transporter permease [Clostridia bacterium]|nr:polar amino acid ABC transporter permease [Clostridia bacterium]
MDIQAIVESFPYYLQAMGTTLKLAFGGIFFSFLIGLLVGFIRYFRVPILKQLADGYTELSRNTPLLIQLFFIYYGLPKIGIQLSKELCGVIGLSFLGGGYMAESIRGGIEDVPLIQIESGKAIGLSRVQLARYIIFPQGFLRSVSNIGANALFLLKETSVFSAIAIMDLTNVTRDLISMYYLTKEYMLMLVISYVIILVPMGLFISYIERRVRYGVFGD